MDNRKPATEPQWRIIRHSVRGGLLRGCLAGLTERAPTLGASHRTPVLHALEPPLEEPVQDDRIEADEGDYGEDLETEEDVFGHGASPFCLYRDVGCTSK